MGKGSRRALLARLLIVVCGGCLLLHPWEWKTRKAADDPFSLGRRLYAGEVPLSGSIVGQSNLLSPKTAACINCHLAARQPSSDQAFAPPLKRSALIQAHRRRNGPPSVFSPASFCRLLRTGVDPVYIVVGRQMPRYQLNDQECIELWQYLMEASDE